jgi:hypothetical protein
MVRLVLMTLRRKVYALSLIFGQHADVAYSTPLIKDVMYNKGLLTFSNFETVERDLKRLSLPLSQNGRYDSERILSLSSGILNGHKY